METVTLGQPSRVGIYSHLIQSG